MKQIKRDERILLADGTAATLSTVQLPDGAFETMLYTGTGKQMEEVTSAQDTTEAAVMATFKHIRERYHVPPLTGRYKALAEALTAAAEYGRTHQGDDDGGTCNFDAATVHLDGWNRKRVEAAAKAAGVGCFFWDLCRSYVFPLGGTGQGNARTRAAEAMKAHLEAAGYDAGMYYQVD